jgi:predicted enzyme related to lactoylglutathione lyase
MDGVVHFEIPAGNEKRAQKFYQSIFGWKMNPMPELDYTILTTTEMGKDRMYKKKGFINGGMVKRDKKVKAPVIYMHVKSIDATLKKIVKSGGKVVQPKTRIQGEMYSAYFKDCEGNVMGLVQGM